MIFYKYSIVNFSDSMNKNSIFFLILSLILFFSCSNSVTFSDLQDKETQTINDFIKRNNIQLVTTLPAENEWKSNLYYKSSTDLYFHLDSVGDKTDTIRANAIVGYRFIEYALDSVQTVRLKNWEPRDFPNPTTINYGTTTALTAVGSGIYQALGLMKNLNSQAEIIVPSALNTSSYSNSVTPVKYLLKITVIK